MQTMTSSALILLPTALDPDSDSEQSLPGPVLAQLRSLTHFVVEDAKSARAWLKRCAWPQPLPQALMQVWNEHTAQVTAQSDAVIKQVLDWLEAGHSVGLLSEAGLPAIADPGQALIAAVHANGYVVRPLVGPSSIMLALMASGLNGQHFEFKGYLPAASDAREASLRSLERSSQQDGRSIIFIETPYRNDAMMASLRAVLSDETWMCVASALGSPKERVYAKTIAQWKQFAWSPGRDPAVFILACNKAKESRLTKAVGGRHDLKAHRRKHF